MVEKPVFETDTLKIRGLGRWPMIRNVGRGFAYIPEDGFTIPYGFDGTGRLTASGELFDAKARTAAHASLPLHTRVRVMRVDTGETMELRINDRLPNRAEGVVLGIPYETARKFGLVEIGQAPCRVVILQYPMVEVGGPDGQTTVHPFQP
jgi:rare lipoprotein A